MIRIKSIFIRVQWFDWYVHKVCTKLLNRHWTFILSPNWFGSGPYTILKGYNSYGEEGLVLAF